MRKSVFLRTTREKNDSIILPKGKTAYTIQLWLDIYRILDLLLPLLEVFGQHGKQNEFILGFIERLTILLVSLLLPHTSSFTLSLSLRRSFVCLAKILSFAKLG